MHNNWVDHRNSIWGEKVKSNVRQVMQYYLCTLTTHSKQNTLVGALTAKRYTENTSEWTSREKWSLKGMRM